MAKKFLVEVVETYSTTYEVEADDSEQAREIANAMAEDDNTLTNPEHFDGRRCAVEQ